ncbi:MAG TPA: ferritin-like domain-containing protein [bacterium]|nr:ferritin-like domain-containing protein [bacterium]
MGTTGRAVVDLDAGALIAELRRGMLMELQVFYSLWIIAIVAEGFHGEELIEHFKADAVEELGHAEKLANRILELGGDPVVDPGDWAAGAGGPWIAPRRDFSDADGMVADQIKAEAAAIQHYNNIAKMTFGKDPVTYNLITELLADEVGHEEFLENLLGRRGSGSSRGHHRRAVRRGGSRAAKKR